MEYDLKGANKPLNAQKSRTAHINAFCPAKKLFKRYFFIRFPQSS